MRKIPNVFVRDWNGNSARVLRDVESASEWALRGEGRATRKWDGTACLVENGVLFKRYDAKHGKTPPVGFVPAQEPDPVTGHWPGWLETSDAKPEDCHHRAAWLALSSPLADGTYELCGPKIQANPEGLIALAFLRHGEPEVYIPASLPWDYDSLRDTLAVQVMEGIVFHHPDGRMAKVKRRDFGLEWPVRA